MLFSHSRLGSLKTSTTGILRIIAAPTAINLRDRKPKNSSPLLTYLGRECCTRNIRFSSTANISKSNGPNGDKHTQILSKELSEPNKPPEAEELASLEPAPSFDRRLPSSIINERIAQRVSQRDSWPEFCMPPGWKFSLYGFQNRRKLTNFQKEMVPDNFDDSFPLRLVDYDALRNPNPDRLQVTWIGHASVLLQTGGWNILTDPVFSQRCSPVQFVGPERYRQPACTVQDLVREGITVDMVLISHNHYDHLDYLSVRDIAESYDSVKFVVPLGLQSWFERWIPSSRCSILQLDWNETGKFKNSKGDMAITSLPMMHWSNRVMWDLDKSLWCGYSIQSTINNSCRKFLFTGDTGWFDGLNDIGKRYGPFDLAAIPIGAYHPRRLMKSSHMNPEEAVRMMHAVRACKAFPIHWGSFPLTLEPVLEPRDLLVKAQCASDAGSEAFAPWLMGETHVV